MVLTLTVVFGWWMLVGAVFGAMLPVLTYARLLYDVHLLESERVPADREHIVSVFALGDIQRQLSLMSWRGRVWTIVRTVGAPALVFGIIGLVIDNVLRFF